MSTKKLTVPGGSVTVTAREWQKDKQHRIYFAALPPDKGQACWDMNRKDWVRIKQEMGHYVKLAIIEAYNL